MNMYLPKTFLAVILLANILIAMESNATIGGKVNRKGLIRYIQSSKEVIIILGLSLVFARARGVMQDSIFGGLVSNGTIPYKANDLMFDTLQTHSFITVVSGIFTDSNNEIKFTNYILTALTFFLFIYYYYLFLDSYFQVSTMRIIFSCLLSFYNPVYQIFETFYPAIPPGSSTTWGVIGIGLSAFVIASVCQKRYIQGGLIFGILLISHLSYFIMTSLVILILQISISISSQEPRSQFKEFVKFIVSLVFYSQLHFLMF